jgi:hypothetical protein
VTVARAEPRRSTLAEARQLCEQRLRDGNLPADRRALLDAAIANAPQLPNLPVPESVKALIAEELSFMALADADTFRAHCARGDRYERLRRIATLQRFPAGQFEWEVSGISRRDVVGVGLRALPRVLWFIARQLGGLGPVFFSHLNPRRPHRSLLELEANRSYYRMARALELQPHVRGFGACSWFRSPATHRVSPHLAWLSAVVVDNGGLVVESGPERADSGVLARSSTRRALYETGRFKPTRGLVIWPRDAMIAWARRHPELAD